VVGFPSAPHARKLSLDRTGPAAHRTLLRRTLIRMAFIRPKRQHPLPAWHGAPPPAAAARTQEASPHTGPSAIGSIAALFGLLITGIFLTGDRPTELARSAGWGAGICVAVTILFDLRGGLQNLMRTDILALVGLYFLTLFEFVFPQPELDVLTDPASAKTAIIACLWGHVGLVAGRHIRFGGNRKLGDLLTKPVPVHWLISIFMACLALGHLQMMMAVDFDFFAMIDAFMAPRFTQPWGRGRLGDWKALIYELSMLLYLVPPIAGIVFARRRSFNFMQLAIVVAGLLFEMFYAFTSGTRNLFISYLVTFLIGYVFALPKGRVKELIIVSTVSVTMALAATVLMLQFRQVGLKLWLNGARVQSEVNEKALHVDMNLFVISQLVATFPSQHDFLGLEVPFLAIIRPIPRAIWPSKPEGMSVHMESLAGGDEAESWTVAASFVGEAYIAGGMIGVLITGLLFGAFTSWWSRLASPNNSELGILIYAVGFFAVAISMRSLFVFTTALLPTLAAIFGTRILVKRVAANTARWLRMNRNAPRRPPPGAPGPRGQRRPFPPSGTR